MNYVRPQYLILLVIIYLREADGTFRYVIFVEPVFMINNHFVVLQPSDNLSNFEESLIFFMSTTHTHVTRSIVFVMYGCFTILYHVNSSLVLHHVWVLSKSLIKKDTVLISFSQTRFMSGPCCRVTSCLRNRPRFSSCRKGAMFIHNISFGFFIFCIKLCKIVYHMPVRYFLLSNVH